jgi:hypothetical protein
VKQPRPVVSIPPVSLHWAEQAAPRLQRSGQAGVVAQLEREEDNFRQALRWTLERGDDAGALDKGLRIAGALGEYAVAASFGGHALATWRELEDTPGMVASLHGVGDTTLWLGRCGEVAG